MWSNPFKKFRQNRATRASAPAPEARILAESTLSTQSPDHSTSSNSYSDYTSYSSYTVSSSASPTYSMAMSSSTASPAYPASLQQASPYYAASSYIPSPLRSSLAYTPSPPPQQLTTGTYPPLPRPPPPSPPTAPLHQELGIAPSRADEIFIARQYEATERRIARAVPDGLARAGQRRHNQEEDTGATVYTVAEEYLINMRQALSGVPMPTVSIAVVPEPSPMIATVDGVLAATSYPLSDPNHAPKDTIPVLHKIEEAKEPSEEESGDESGAFVSDEHEPVVSTPDRDTTRHKVVVSVISES